MNALFHLVRKDFRHWWKILAVWCPILVLSVAWDTKIELWLGDPAEFETLPDQAIDENIILVLSGSLMVAIDFMLRAAIVSKLVHEDATVGSGEFWMSRPIAGGTLLASKAICLAIGLVVPAIVLGITVRGLLTGEFTLSTNEVLVEAVLVAWLTVLAALTSSLARMVFLGGILAAAGFGGFLALVWLAGPMVGVVEYATWSASSLPWLVFFVVCAATIWHQYLTRRTMRSMVGAASGIAVSLLALWELWDPGVF